MEFRMLGAVEAYAHGRRIDLGPRRQRFVLAVLALEVGREVPVDRLVRLAWPVSPPQTASHAIRVVVSRLRAVLMAADAARQGVRLLTQGAGYLLGARPADIDVHRFRELVRQARAATDDLARISLFDQALGLWRGPALSGSAPDGSRDQLCQPLEEARLAALEDRVEAGLRLGRHAELIEELVELTGRFPLRERLVRQIMLAYYRSGRPSDALGAYHRTRGLLAREFGIDPGAELRQTELAILRSDPAILHPRPATPEPTAPEPALAGAAAGGRRGGAG